jgi:hypothetical protein
MSAFGTRYHSSGDDTVDREGLVHDIVNCSLCKCHKLLMLLVVQAVEEFIKFSYQSKPCL